MSKQLRFKCRSCGGDEFVNVGDPKAILLQALEQPAMTGSVRIHECSPVLSGIMDLVGCRIGKEEIDGNR